MSDGAVAGAMVQWQERWCSGRSGMSDGAVAEMESFFPAKCSVVSGCAAWGVQFHGVFLEAIRQLVIMTARKLRHSSSSFGQEYVPILLFE
jgi:hypothetical protein